MRLILFIGLAMLSIVQSSAFAQSTSVDLGPTLVGALDYLGTVIAAGIAVAIGMISARVYAWTGVNIEARHREALHSAIMTGVNAGLAKVGDAIGGKAIDVRSTAAAQAINYVLGAVPDAVRFFGLTDSRIREMVMARLSQLDRERFGGALIADYAEFAPMKIEADGR
ncbi:hypothetical protein ABE438_14545 [Bosea sp. TWI1241]|uniref:hypothetical protein n=1 Tax=Bosea sp. TWI1241 TaxID=3148904 RepID=UPI003208F50D